MSPLMPPKTDTFSSGSSRKNIFKSLFNLCTVKEDEPQRKMTMQIEQQIPIESQKKLRKISGTETIVQKMDENKREFRIIIKQEIPYLTKWIKQPMLSLSGVQTPAETICYNIQKNQLIQKSQTILLMQMEFHPKLLKALSSKSLILHMDSEYNKQQVDSQDQFIIYNNSKYGNLEFFDCILIVPYLNFQEDNIADEEKVQCYIEKMLTIIYNSNKDLIDRVVLLLPSQLQTTEELMKNLWEKSLDHEQVLQARKYSKNNKIQQSNQKPKLTKKITYVDEQRLISSQFQCIVVQALQSMDVSNVFVQLRKVDQTKQDFYDQINCLKKFFCDHIFFYQQYPKQNQEILEFLEGLLDSSTLQQLLYCYLQIFNEQLQFMKLHSECNRQNYYCILIKYGVISREEDHDRLQQIFLSFQMSKIYGNFEYREKIKHIPIKVSKSKSIDGQLDDFMTQQKDSFLKDMSYHFPESYTEI
ncbi:hypothetical protein pb186bvf_008121 [Paramecium bursaria]